MRKSNQQRLVFALLLPTIIMVFTGLLLLLVRLNRDYWGLPIATSMLLGNFILIYILNLSYDELGLKYEKDHLPLHVIGFLLILAYSFVTIYITGIKSFNSLTKEVWYTVLFFIIAAFSDEIYFRGIIYRLLEVWDDKTAFIGSSFIYGLWTIPVGALPLTLALLTLPLPFQLGPIERIVIGLALGVLRYTSKMILLIIPLHIIFYIQNDLIVNNNVPAYLIIFSYMLLLVVIGLIIYIQIEFSKRMDKPPTHLENE